MTKATSSAVWEAASQWLPLTNPDVEYWWKLTGPHMSHMMVASGYSVEAQYNALLFHYHWIVSLAPAPNLRSPALSISRIASHPFPLRTALSTAKISY